MSDIKGKDILRSVSDIDDKYINEILQEDLESGKSVPRKRRRPSATIISFVAVAAAGVLLFVTYKSLAPNTVSSPTAGEYTKSSEYAADTEDYEASEEYDIAAEENGSDDLHMEADTGNGGAATESDVSESASAQTQDEATAAEEPATVGSGHSIWHFNDGKTKGEADIVSDEAGTIDELGLTMEVSDVTASGAVLEFVQDGGNPEGELLFGDEFEIEVWNDDEWEALDKTETAVTSKANVIARDDLTEYELDWESVYGQLESGHYRVTVTVLDSRDAGDYDEYEISAEFEVR